MIPINDTVDWQTNMISCRDQHCLFPTQTISILLYVYDESLAINVCLMVFNATFNNISVISWRSVSLVEETGGPGENHRSVASHWQTLSHDVVHLALIEIRTHNTKHLIERGSYFLFPLTKTFFVKKALVCLFYKFIVFIDLLLVPFNRRFANYICCVVKLRASVVRTELISLKQAIYFAKTTISQWKK
jgi:hypothetical protein